MKKGVSPLIATVLIIGFAVGLAAIIITFSSKYVEKVSEEVEEEAEIKITCTQRIDLNVKYACISGDHVNALIENTGSAPINSFIFRVIGSAGKATVSEDVGLETGGIKLFMPKYDTNSIKGVGIPKELEIFPRILNKEKRTLEVCKETKVELEPCEKIPTLSNPKLWKFKRKVGNDWVEMKKDEDFIFGIEKKEDFVKELENLKTEVDGEEKSILEIAAEALAPPEEEDPVEYVKNQWLVLTTPTVAFAISNVSEHYEIKLESVPFVIPEKINALCFSSIWLGEFSPKIVVNGKRCDIPYSINPLTGEVKGFEKNSILYEKCQDFDQLKNVGCEIKPGDEVLFSVYLSGENIGDFFALTRFCLAEDWEGGCLF